MDRPWTEARVRDALVARLRDPYQPYRTRPRSADGHVIDLKGTRLEFRIMDAAYLALVMDEEDEEGQRDYLMLVVWARITAQHSTGSRAETSLREYCSEVGWSWSTFNRTHKRAAQTVARMFEFGRYAVRDATAQKFVTSQAA